MVAEPVVVQSAPVVVERPVYVQQQPVVTQAVYSAEVRPSAPAVEQPTSV